VYCEFNRVVGENLKDNFFDALDRFSPSLMDLFRKRRDSSSPTPPTHVDNITEQPGDAGLQAGVTDTTPADCRCPEVSLRASGPSLFPRLGPGTGGVRAD
ncbi:hypothetical protein KUCAC02_032566, partial [Chaenocephalus aceratus]